MSRKRLVVGLVVVLVCVPSAAWSKERRGYADFFSHGSGGVSAHAVISYAREHTQDREAGTVAVGGEAPSALITDIAVATQPFSSIQDYAVAPCLRRKYGGSLADVLSFCAPADPSSPAGNGNGGGGSSAPALTPVQVAQILADRAVALAPEPQIRVAPARVGLTGLDSYFWLEPPEPITASAGVGGLVVTAVAQPVQYVWDFGDGKDLVTSDPGRPWSNNRPGSISHMYESDGRYELSLEQIWEARWQVGSGAWQRLGYFSNSAERPYPVRQVVPVLVPGDGAA